MASTILAILVSLMELMSLTFMLMNTSSGLPERQQLHIQCDAKKQQAHLLQRPRNVLTQLKCCKLLQTCGSTIQTSRSKGLAISEWHWKSLKVIGNGAKDRRYITSY